MKRSGIQRKTPLKARRKRKSTTDKRWRSPEYIAWIKQRPCVFCAMGPCDPHHVIGLHWGLSGAGLTAPDSFCMPLCRTHHDAVHRSPGLQRQQPTWLRWTIRAALAERDANLGDGARDELTHALAFIEAREEMA